MKKFLLALVISIFTIGLLAPVAQAGVVFDFKTKTCGEFLELAGKDKEATGMILLWLDGYLSGLTGDTVFKQENFESFAEDIADYCQENPETSLLTATEKVGTD